MKNIFGTLSSTDQTRLDPWGLLVLRVCSGLLMIYGHGWGKLMKMLGDEPIKFIDPLGIGMELSFYLVVLAEFLCALLLVIGLFTRWATVPLIVTMLVAVFLIHGSDPFGDKELALLYLLPFIVLFFCGPGKYSLDYKLGHRNME